MLQLNTIAMNGTNPSAERVATETPFSVIALRANHNHLIDRLIEIKTMLSRRRLLDVIPDPVNNVSRAVGIAHDTAERFPDLAQVGGCLSKN